MPKTRRIDKLEILYTERGFPYIYIIDRYKNKIRVQQSSMKLTDVWLFIDEIGILDPDNNDILLTYENVKDINAFSSYLRKNL